MIECQHCGTTIPDEVAYDSTIPKGESVVMRKYNDPHELGTVTDYYCNPDCFAEEEL